MSEMTIGRTAAAAEVGVETVRFYERKGLIDRPPKPAFGGFVGGLPDPCALTPYYSTASNL